MMSVAALEGIEAASADLGGGRFVHLCLWALRAYYPSRSVCCLKLYVGNRDGTYMTGDRDEPQSLAIGLQREFPPATRF